MIYSISLARRAAIARAVHPARGAEPRERGLSLPVVVEERDVLRVRRAVIQTTGGMVEIVRCVPIRKTTKVRLIIEFQAGALDEVLRRILQSIEAGELGRVGFAP